MDSLGILENEKSVFDINEENIKLENGRYQVHLPFKEEHPIITDNYRHCRNRLHSLRKKLEKNAWIWRNTMILL